MKQFTDPLEVINIPVHKYFPYGDQYTHGRCVYIAKAFTTPDGTFPSGLWIYDHYDSPKQGKWKDINDHSNLQVKKMSSVNCIQYDLRNNEGTLGSIYADVALSPDQTHATVIVRGSGGNEAEGFIFRNRNTGVDLLKIDASICSWKGFELYSTYNLNLEDFEPRHVGLDVHFKYTAKVGDILFVDSSKQEQQITLPPNPNQGNSVKIFDDAGTFGENVCTVRPGTAKVINGRGGDFILNQSRTIATFIYQNVQKGWRIEYSSQSM